MSISLSSARRLTVGALGASAAAGAMLFGALPMAQAAAPVTAAATTAVAPVTAAANTATPGALQVAPVFWGHHHHTHRHGGIHIA